MAIATAPEILEEEEVTTAKLAAVFKAAFFSSTVDKDGDLVVKTDGPGVFVLIKEKHKLLKFMAMYGLKESAPEQKKLELVNRMNDGFIFVRFSVARADALMADYYLPYEAGIPTFQLVTALRLFAKVVPGAIRTADTDDVVI